VRALVSIHDVTPATLGRVAALIESLPLPGIKNLMLLVVPGFNWRATDIDRLAAWQSQGVVFAGHGWSHEAREISGPYHRLHSAILSRRVAEHLALSPDEIAALLQRCHEWFDAHGLATPDYYVPPAWAMGAIGLPRLAGSPFRYFETTSGILDVETGRRRLLPLVGFEADTRLRQALLTVSNSANRRVSRLSGTLRIAIHPFDDTYYLADKLRRYCRRVKRLAHYRDVFLDRSGDRNGPGARRAPRGS